MAEINDIVPVGKIDADTRLALMNAVHFKGDWRLEFKKESTRRAPFHLTPEKSVEVDLMYQQADVNFARTDNVLAIELPYRGGNLAMVVLLPTKVDGLPGLEKSLTLENYDKLLAQTHSELGQYSCPSSKPTKKAS